MSDHILDRPVWSSLTTGHAALAIGDDLAKRFPSDVSPFAAPRDHSCEALAALANLIPHGGGLMVVQNAELPLPPGTTALETGLGVQLIPESLACDDVDAESIEPLSDADAPEMHALAALTKPGPFESRTNTLGRFLGIKIDGRLAAMAGERLKHPGWCEISGVCTHPDYRGHGFARKLSAAVARQILERGEAPYLHSYADNDSAIRLYESLGFCIRTHVHAVLIGREGDVAQK